MEAKPELPATPELAPQDVSPPAQVVLPPALGTPPFIIPGQGTIGVQQVAMQVWQSQYPPPEAVERYEAVLAGSFDRILTMVEAGQRSQAVTVAQVNANLQSDTRRGAWLGFVVAMAGLGGALYCATIGQPLVAGACIGLPLLGLAKALVESGSRAAIPTVQAAKPSEKSGSAPPQ